MNFHILVARHTHIKEGWVSVPKSRQSQILMECPGLAAMNMNTALTLSMNMKKDNMNKFLVKHNIDIPNPIPIKPMLPEKILERNVLKQYVIDSFTKKVGYDVLQLPPYYCVSNPIEMVENRLKCHAFHLNVYISQSSKVEE